jgi:hypothetical protein
MMMLAPGPSIEHAALDAFFFFVCMSWMGDGAKEKGGNSLCKSFQSIHFLSYYFSY